MSINANTATTDAFDAIQPAFNWHVYDIKNALPSGWAQQLLDVAARHSETRNFHPTVATAREGKQAAIPMEAVDGDVLAAEVPWLPQLYSGAFLQLGASLTRDRVHPSRNQKVALSLNIQRGMTARYPCHLDSNPLEGLLYLTDCTAGGELAIARNPEARSTQEVDADCILIPPREGQLLLFDARRNPHYVRPLRSPDAVRAVVTMNYYTDSCPEVTRPAGLDEQLFVPRSRTATRRRVTGTRPA